MESIYKTQNAEVINLEIAKLPKAQAFDIYFQPTFWSQENVPRRKVVVVNSEKYKNECVSIMSYSYKLIQHEEAFRPIIEGLTLMGAQNFQFTMWNNARQANLAVYVGEGVDGVKFGFRCKNSFDGSSAINFGYSAYRRIVETQIVEKEHVLVWGMRQVCSNGLIMKVPLKTCKYMDAVQVTRIKELINENSRIKHMGDVHTKLKMVQHIVEAFTLLKQPLNMMIIDAQSHTLRREDAIEFIKKYFGRRKLDSIMERYDMEDATLWGLYNSITFIASHSDLKDSMRENMTMGAADLLEGELTA